MPTEPISPELVLVDAELGARARAALPDIVARPMPPLPASPRSVPPATTAPRDSRSRPYPLWARVTAALWILVLGILIGGAAIPHAQDKPRVIPPAEDPSAVICKKPAKAPVPPTPRFDPVIPSGGQP